MRTLERTRRAQDIIAEQRRTRLGLDLPEYNGDDATAWTEAERADIESVRRTAGGFFRAGEVEMTSDNVRARIVADDDARRHCRCRSRCDRGRRARRNSSRGDRARSWPWPRRAWAWCARRRGTWRERPRFVQERHGGPRSAAVGFGQTGL